jgi:hypothetical protein
VTLEASTSVTPAPPLTWVGCDSNPVADQCTVNLTTARSVTATYGTQVTISLAQTGNISGGSIRDNQSPNLINCPTGACSFTYSPGQQIDFSPTNNTNWTFEGFSTATGCPTVLPNGDCRVNTNTSQGFTVGARFRWPLTFTEPIGGSITAPGFACPGACTTSYPADQIPVRVTTNPSSTWDIYTRTGCAPVAGSPFLCDAAPTNTNGAVNVATTFGRPLTLTANQGGSITRTSGQSAVGCSNGATNCYVYPNNASVNLTAVPAAASSRSFLSWTGCSNNNNPCTVIMNDQRTLVADFGFGLTANTVGGGTVTQSSGTQSCGTNCLVHADGTLVTLTASPNSGWDFLGWQNCPGGASGTTCQVTVNAALTVTAPVRAAPHRQRHRQRHRRPQPHHRGPVHQRGRRLPRLPGPHHRHPHRHAQRPSPVPRLDQLPLRERQHLHRRHQRRPHRHRPLRPPAHRPAQRRGQRHRASTREHQLHLLWRTHMRCRPPGRDPRDPHRQPAHRLGHGGLEQQLQRHWHYLQHHHQR